MRSLKSGEGVPRWKISPSSSSAAAGPPRQVIQADASHMVEAGKSTFHK